MDLQRLPKNALSASSSLVDLPEYIITSFVPGAQPFLKKYPRLFRVLGVFLALWYFGPLARLQALWSRFSSLTVATVNVTSEEDLFGYMVTYLTERKTLRADQTLNAISNPPQEINRRNPRGAEEESNRRAQNEPKIKYEQDQGWQLFVFKRRLFWTKRHTGDGHVYIGHRYKRMEILSVSCLGRDTKPVKEMLEEIFQQKKTEERTLTTIRRPTSGGYSGKLSWSRLTSKPRRGLDTVILDGSKKEEVLADVEEYLDETTKQFYGNRGIPYRRGYLFFGPPGVGKTSMALALAAKFNLDVYNMTLLDQDLTDSDLISLLNQLPGKSLLLLEDIDTAGLSRKGKPAAPSRRRQRQATAVNRLVGIPPEKKDDATPDSDDEDAAGQRSNISLSGLLNAIDGVAAPEGHILIMTTNKPEALDDALVRAGRISVRVGFAKATRVQAEEIFKRMYVEDTSTSSSDAQKPEPDIKPKEKPEPVVTEERLEELATNFATALPEGEYSPADLQDYLLVHKKDPEKAVADIVPWMEKMQEERRKKEDEREADAEVKRKRKEEKAEAWKEQLRKAMKESTSPEEKGKVEKGAEAKDQAEKSGKGDDDDGTTV